MVIWWEYDVNMMVNNGYLVGGIATPLKNMIVTWDDYFKYMRSMGK